MAEPTNKQSPVWVRLHDKDRKAAKNAAGKMGVPLSTWIRIVVMERLAKERETQ